MMLATIILSHNLSAVLSLGMVGVFVLIYSWQRRELIPLAAATAAVILGLGISSFFAVPAMVETGLTHTEKLTQGGLDFHINFVNPIGEIDRKIEQMADTPYSATRWGAIDLHPTYPYGLFPMKLSLLQGMLLLGFVGTLALRKRPPVWVLAAAVAFLLLFYLHSSWSEWVWDRLPLLQSFQFPWRMLVPMGLCLSLMGAWTMQSFVARHDLPVLLLVSAAMIVSGTALLPAELEPFEGGVQVNRVSLIKHEYRNARRVGTMVDGQFLPRSVQWDEKALGLADLPPRYDATFAPQAWVGGTAAIRWGDEAWIVGARRGQTWMEALVRVGSTSKVAFHSIYYPGWTAYLDGRPTAIEPSGWQADDEGRQVALGVSQVTVPEGDHLVRLQFEDTPLRRWANLASLMSLIVFAGMLAVASWRRWGSKTAVNLALGSFLLLAVVQLGFSHFQSGSQWTENREVMNLISDAGHKRLEIAAPAGETVGDYVNVQEWTLNGDSRKVLFMHPPATATKKLWIPEGAALEFGVALDPQVWNRPGVGVRFRVEARRGETATVLVDKYIDPKSNPDDRRWTNISVDLQPLANEQVELVFRTMPGTSAEFAWAGWGNPRIVVR